MEKNFEKEVQQLSGYIYHNGKNSLPADWKVLKDYTHLGSGFYAEAYYKNGKIVIIYRGTDTEKGIRELKKDYDSDYALFKNKPPKQLINARRFYDSISQTYPKNKICLGGHSMGGSLAQMIGSTVKGLQTFTFNAYGTKGIKGFTPRYPENVINYGNSRDMVFSQNINEHVGKILIINNNNKPPILITEKSINKYHPVEKMGDLSSAKEYSSSQNQNNKSVNNQGLMLRPAKRLELRLQQEWAAKTQSKKDASEKFENTKSLENYINKVSNSNKIYTQEEISSFSKKEYEEHKKAVDYQRKTIGIPTERQAKKRTESGGMVHVSAYVRSDGVRVESYYRSAPSR